MFTQKVKNKFLNLNLKIILYTLCMKKNTHIDSSELLLPKKNPNLFCKFEKCLVN